MVLSWVYLQPKHSLLTHGPALARATRSPHCREEKMGLITATVASAPTALPGGSRVAAVTPAIIASSGLCEPLWPQALGGCATQLRAECTQSCWLQPWGDVCVSWRESNRFYGQNKALWSPNLSCILLTSFPTAVQTVLVFQLCHIL